MIYTAYLFILSILALIAIIMAIISASKDKKSEKRTNNLQDVVNDLKNDVSYLKEEVQKIKESEKRHSDLQAYYMKKIIDKLDLEQPKIWEEIGEDIANDYKSNATGPNC